MTQRNRDLARRGTVAHRVVPAQLACRVGARPLTIALVAVWGLGFGAVPVAAQSWMARAMPANLEGAWPCSCRRYKARWRPDPGSAA